MKVSNKPHRRAIVILGMHRSGTSALARTVNLCGVDLGSNLMPPVRDVNEKGFWENIDVYRLHKKLLQELNSSWHDVRDLPDGWWNFDIVQKYKLEIISILEREFAKSCFWGIKDPRISRFLPMWHPLIEQMGCRPYYIIIVRSPLEVAASLAKRDGFSEGKSCLLWLRHNIEAEKGSRNALRVFVTYEELLGNWKKLMSRIQRTFRFRWPVSLKQATPEIDSFLENRLRHNLLPDNVLIEDRNLNKWVRDLYLTLKDTNKSEDAQIIRNVDCIEVELKELDKLYSPVLGEFWNRYHRMNTDLQNRNQQIDDTRKRLEEFQQAKARKDEEIVELQNGIKGRDDRINQLNSELRQSHAELSSFRESAKVSEMRFSDMESKVGDRNERIRQLNAEFKDIRRELASIREATLVAETLNGEMQSKVKERDERIRQLNVEFKDIRRELASTREATLVAETLNGEMQSKVAERDERIRQLESVGESLRDQLAAAEESVFKPETEITILQTGIEKKDEFMKKLETGLENLKGELDKANKSQSIRKKELRQLYSEIKQKNEKIDQQKADAENLRNEADSMQKEVENFKHDRATILKSTSWKFTAPLRWMSMNVRKLKHNLVTARFLFNRQYRLLKNSALFDTSFYLEQYPDIELSGMNPIIHYIVFGSKEGRDPNPLFDTSYYLEKNPDVSETGVNPLAHYLNHGAAEGRDPNPLFDTSYYLEKNPNLSDSSMNPLVHYLNHGTGEGRDPNPLFETSYYLEKNPDVSDSGMNPLVHYLSHGAADERGPNPLFDTSYYLEKNPDVAESGVNPLAHYLGHGAGEGRDPNPLFDTAYYLEHNQDVAESGVNPIFHYLKFGGKGGCNPHPLFDTLYYLQKNADVKSKGINPLVHFIQSGWKEGRNANPLFDTRYYHKTYPEVKKSGMNPLFHYLISGEKEGLNPHPFFDTKYYLENNKDVKDSGENPLVHFILYGWKEGRNPCTSIKTKNIHQKLPDLMKDGFYTFWNILIDNFENNSATNSSLQKNITSDKCFFTYTVIFLNLTNKMIGFIDNLMNKKNNKSVKLEIIVTNPINDSTLTSYLNSNTVIKRVKYDSKKNLTPQINYLIEQSIGDIIVFFEKDAFIDENWYLKLDKCFQSDPGIMIADVLTNKTFSPPIKNNKHSSNDVFFENFNLDELSLFIEIFSKKEYPDLPAVYSDSFFAIRRKFFRNVLIENANIKTMSEIKSYLSRHTKESGLRISLVDNLYIFDYHYKKGSLTSKNERDTAKIECVSHLANLINKLITVSTGNKKIVYTAIIGNYDFIKEPEYVNDDTDYICFTTNKNLKSKIFNIKLLPEIQIENTKLARLLKVLPHLFFIGYDYNIWTDGSTKIRGNNINKLIENHLNDASIALHRHITRNCIYDEATECINQKKDDVKKINDQIAILKFNKYSPNNGLVETAQLVRKFDDLNKSFGKEWWYYINNYSIRDQLSFNYVAWKLNFSYNILPESQWLDPYFKNYLHFKEPFDEIPDGGSVSLIMLVRDALDVTKVSIESVLKKTRYKSYELIVVDNDSGEETKEYLSSVSNKNENVTILTNEKNQSFSKGNNDGVKIATGSMVLLINNDIEIIDPNWLNILVFELNKDKTIGAVGPILLYPNYKVQSASVVVEVKDNELIMPAKELKNYRHTGFVDAVSGACFLIHKELYEQLEGLDENFFYGQEDIDLCLKLSKMKRKIKLISHCEVIHHESYTPTFNETNLKNREIIKKKWKGRLDFLNPNYQQSYADILQEKLLSYRSFIDLKKCISSNLDKIPGNTDLIVGVPRSGMIPAYFMGLLLNTPVITLDEFKHDVSFTSGDRKIKELNKPQNKLLNILFVDDSINYGNAYKRVIANLPEYYQNNKYKFKFLAVYASEYANQKDIISLEKVNLPRIFEWNYKYHGIAQFSCYDMDGVLCVDPTDEENDDGPKYIEFMKNATPLYIPVHKIKVIVTSRSEKFRKQTEEWLKKHNVKYDNLIMLDLPSKEERIRLNAHGTFKAEIYSKIKDAYLFVESNKRQAIKIAELTKKPVICTETDEFFPE